MAEITAKPKPMVENGGPPVVKSAEARQLGLPAIRLASVVERTAELSAEVLTSLETGERAAIEAVGRFVITVEEAIPQEVAATSQVAKRITESGLEMVDRLVHTEYDVLRKVVDSAARSLSRDGAALRAA